MLLKSETNCSTSKIHAHPELGETRKNLHTQCRVVDTPTHQSNSHVCGASLCVTRQSRTGEGRACLKSKNFPDKITQHLIMCFICSSSSSVSLFLRTPDSSLAPLESCDSDYHLCMSLVKEVPDVVISSLHNMRSSQPSSPVFPSIHLIRDDIPVLALLPQPLQVVSLLLDV